MLRHPAMRATGWSWTNEGPVAGRKKCHACFVTENTAAAKPTARIDRKYRNLLPAFCYEIFTERFDEAAFAGTGNASDSNADRISAHGQAFLDDLLSKLPICRARAFNQRDGFGKY